MSQQELIAKMVVAGNNLAKPAARLQKYCEKGNTICFDSYSDSEDGERYASYLAAWRDAVQGWEQEMGR